MDHLPGDEIVFLYVGQRDAEGFCQNCGKRVPETAFFNKGHIFAYYFAVRSNSLPGIIIVCFIRFYFWSGEYGWRLQEVAIKTVSKIIDSSLSNSQIRLI